MARKLLTMPDHLGLAAPIACVVAILVFVVLTLGGEDQPPIQPELTVSQLAGTWVSAQGGGTITFYADHQFSATDVNINGVLGAACQPGTAASGGWEFTGPNGDSISSDPTEYSSGDTIFLFLTTEGPANTPRQTCADQLGGSELTTWQIDGPLGLCVEVDPDYPCGSKPWVRQTIRAERIPLPSDLGDVIQNA